MMKNKTKRRLKKAITYIGIALATAIVIFGHYLGIRFTMHDGFGKAKCVKEEILQIGDEEPTSYALVSIDGTSSYNIYKGMTCTEYKAKYDTAVDEIKAGPTLWSIVKFCCMFIGVVMMALEIFLAVIGLLTFIGILFKRYPLSAINRWINNGSPRDWEK